MGLGGEVDDLVRLGHQLVDQFGVAYVALDELEARMVEFEVLERAGCT